MSQTFDDGWFVHKLRGYKRTSDEISLMAGGYRYATTTFTATVPEKQTVFQQVVVNRPSKEEQADIKGVVVDEAGEPIYGALIFLHCDLNCGRSVGITTGTGGSGQFQFRGLAARGFDIVVETPKHHKDYERIQLKPGTTADVKFTLPKNKKVTMDYVFQGDGNRLFHGPQVKKGTIVLQRPDFRIMFADGSTKGELAGGEDIRLECRDCQLFFRNGINNGKTGFYDAGEVPFDSVKEAAEQGYAINARPCVVGHVYVVRTYDGRHYAKFIVRSIEDAED